MFRLAVFTDTYDDVNGVSVIYHNLVRAAGRAPGDSGWIAVFCPGDATGVEHLDRATVFRYRPRPRMTVPRYPQQKIGWVRRGQVERDFADGGFDAVLVADPAPLGLVGRDLARRHGLPLIGFYHTRFPVYLAVYARGMLRSEHAAEAAEALGYRFMRRVYGACDLVLAQSIAMADEVRRASDAPLAVWDTGVDLAEFSPAPAPEFRAAHGIAPDATVVLYVGRLAPEKDLDVLGALSRRMPDLHFVMVGDGPYAATLHAIARATFTGFLRGRDLADAYRAADLFVFPSTTDTFGNVLVEAMASGLPLVVVDQGPPGELVTRTGAGLTYPAGDLDAAERAVRHLVQDRAARAAMAEAALAHARRHDWADAYARFMAVCAGVVRADG